MNTNTTKLPASINILFFIISVMLCGFIAINLGKDIDFDLANYHYYNPYALLHHRWSENYWPATYVHVYLSPTADLLSYVLINTFSAKLAVFISGAIHGINLWILFNILYHFVPKKYYPVITAFCIALIGMYGPLGFKGIGNFKNDHILSIFILLFVWLQILIWEAYVFANKINFKLLIVAAFVLGFGAQLKLTGNTYILSALFTLLIMPIVLPDKIKIIFVTSFFALLGSLISSGYWMYLLWIRYRNPFFPFLNNIFQSTDYPPVNFRYLEFQPHTLWQFLLYPFYFSFNGTLAETPSRDFRYAFVYILFGIAACVWIHKKTNHSISNRLSLSTYWLFAFFIFSYIICMFYFGALRYIIANEMLAPLIILLLVQYIFVENKKHTVIVVSSLYLILIFTVSPAKIGTRLCWWLGTDYFDVKIPQQIKATNEAMVLMPYSMYARSNDPRPQTYLIPYLPPNWHFIGIQFHQHNYISPDERVNMKIRKMINDFYGNFYVLSVEYTLPELYRAAKKLGLLPQGHCQRIFSHRQFVNNANVLICAMKKMNEANNDNL